MPNKSFSIYSSENFTIEESDQLIIEVANSHLACVVTKENNTVISACELFTFAEGEGEKLDILFNDISQQSRILSCNPVSAKIYINNEFCVPVPIFKFNKEIAAEYLHLVFGENVYSKIHFEHIPVEPGVMNVYRVNENLFNYLNQRFINATFHHSYSNIIRRVAGNTSVLPNEFIAVQFYNTFLIAAVMKNGVLQLIQTFAYETPQDVMYFLLNIINRLELLGENLMIKISGMIDVDFKLYRELITYFKKVMIENETVPAALPELGEHPLHYFTPFFNLAL
jgi:hypothetical protein